MKLRIACLCTHRGDACYHGSADGHSEALFASNLCGSKGSRKQTAMQKINFISNPKNKLQCLMIVQRCKNPLSSSSFCTLFALFVADDFTHVVIESTIDRWFKNSKAKIKSLLKIAKISHNQKQKFTKFLMRVLRETLNK
jgi:hypothetical protein